MDGGAWWATVHGFAKESDTTEWLTLFPIHMLSFHFVDFFFSLSKNFCLIRSDLFIFPPLPLETDFLIILL